MITEDYVSFETAKLLKEKGFDCSSYSHYRLDNGELCRFNTNCSTNIEPNNYITAPTLQLAMKWLREVYGVVISICNGNHKTDNRDISTPDNVYYFFVITDARAVYDEEKQCYKEFISYEEACEAAIKYCLENLA